jgi:hypothetical protein
MPRAVCATLLGLPAFIVARLSHAGQICELTQISKRRLHKIEASFGPL